MRLCLALLSLVGLLELFVGVGHLARERRLRAREKRAAEREGLAEWRAEAARECVLLGAAFLRSAVRVARRRG